MFFSNCKVYDGCYVDLNFGSGWLDWDSMHRMLIDRIQKLVNIGPLEKKIYFTQPLVLMTVFQ